MGVNVRRRSAGLALVVLVASLLTPISSGGTNSASAAPNYILGLQTVSGWSGKQTSLTASQKEFIRKWVETKAQFNLSQANCTAFFAPGTSSSQKTILSKRATATCNEIKKNATWVIVKTVLSSTRIKSHQGQIRVRLITDPTMASPTPAPSAGTEQPSTSKPPAEFGLTQASPVEKCKITSTGSGWNTVGFPINLRFGGRETYQTLPKAGKIRAVVIGIDFPNYKGTTPPAEYVKGATEKNNAFFEAMSYGAVSFEYTVLPRYIRMSKNAEDYGISTWGSSGDYGAYYREALAGAAREFDIGGYDVAYVMASPQTPASAITAGPGFPSPETTEDGVIPLGTATGGMPVSETAFRWMAHETGHLFGWVDLYDVSGRDDPGVGRHSRFGWWDIMSMNWETFNLEINGWFRFQLGWIPDSDITCIELAKLSEVGVNVENLALSKGKRLVVIRTGEQKALVIERRSITQYAPMLNNPQLSGVLVYEVDGEKNFQMAPVTILKKKGLVITDQALSEFALRPSDEVSTGNILVKVVSQSSTGSFVQISTK